MKKMQLRSWGMAIALLVAGGAGAQEQKASFDGLDKNKDGLISVREAQADKQVAAQFAAADKNQDGFLSREEFATIRR